MSKTDGNGFIQKQKFQGYERKIINNWIKLDMIKKDDNVFMKSHWISGYKRKIIINWIKLDPN